VEFMMPSSKASLLLLLFIVALPARFISAAEPALAHDQSESSLRAAFPTLTFLDSGVSLVAYRSDVSAVVDRLRSELPRSHPLYLDDGFEADDRLLLETAICDSDGQAYYVVFSEGPSADPSFYFIKADSSSDQPWAEVPGNTLAIPTLGAVYAANRYNNFFTKRTKYAYSPGGLHEVPQPFFFVGLKTQALKPITLYASPTEDSQVTQLPAGAEIEVLLTDDRQDDLHRTCFLVKTPFGLLGWVWVPETQYQSGLIEGISWWGD
jgi:hypothetical protein